MTDILDEHDDIHDTPLAQALSERYLAYAISTITARSLPDVRDGLKPVHRRILYAMRALRLDPDAGFKKCARIVGDVMGRFHPHGDQAIYDALVRLAQSFAQRYPLVDGQGNFGNLDGDNPAAMRYTEARMSAVAEALLRDIDADTVDFRPNYDGEEEEPVVLPAAFPNLLANGAQGIAVGMATNIPPHNAGEISAALLHLLRHPNATVDKLVQLMPGPDFPTGGVMVEPRESVLEAYRTGRGGFRTRARWQVEEGKRGTYRVIVTEIPYQVQKGRLLEKLAELLQQRKLPLLADMRDESAEDIRIVLEPRSGKVDAAQLMEQLFRLTELEVRVGLNLNVIDADGTPKVMNLREALQAFLDHREDVLVRRSRHRLGQIDRRLEVLAGYLVAYLNLDEVIRTIREADEPRAELMRRFELTEMQAEAILNMRLRALHRLQEIEIRRENEALLAERQEVIGLIEQEARRHDALAAEIREVRDRFGGDDAVGRRRTEIAEVPEVEPLPVEALVEREPITVICSEKGWIRTIKGHVADGPDVKYKEGDRGRFWLHAETSDKIVIFATNGRFYTLACDRLPGGRGHGEPVRLLLDMGNEVDIVDMLVHDPARRLVVASSAGRGFLVEESQVVAQTRAGKQVLNLNADEEAKALAPVPAEGDHVGVVGENKKILVFPLEELPSMTRGRGVLLQRYKGGGLSDVTVLRATDGLSWRSGDRTRVEGDIRPWLGRRGQAGRMAPKGFATNKRFR